MKPNLKDELAKLKAKSGSWSSFEDDTGINHSILIRILSKEIHMTPNMAFRLAQISRRKPKQWLLLWVDHWYDETPVQNLHSRDESAPTRR